jgi:hypothetical protein
VKMENTSFYYIIMFIVSTSQQKINVFSTSMFSVLHSDINSPKSGVNLSGYVHYWRKLMQKSFMRLSSYLRGI